MLQPYRKEFYIAAQDVDFTRHQTLPLFGSCLLNTAGLAAAELGMGLEHLRDRNLAWVLSRFHLEIERLPHIDETITVETWVSDCGKLTTGRNFQVFDSDGKIIAQATSLWSVIDFETRRPIDLLAQADMSPFIVDKTVSAVAPQRVEELHDEPIATHTVCYSDLDFNAHTNSMKYVQWMLDTLDLAQFSEKQIATFDINYTHEAVYGEQISILRKTLENGYHFDLKAENGRSCCKAKIAFRQ